MADILSYRYHYPSEGSPSRNKRYNFYSDLRIQFKNFGEKYGG
jgi:hypothetical protein